MRYLFSLCLVFSFYAAFAQLNLSVGYTISSISPDGLESVLEDYNAQRPWLRNQMDDVDFLNGYSVGLRCKIDRIAFDFKWENQINRSTANGIDPDTDSEFEQTLFFKISSFGIGLESFLTEKISLHGNFEFNKFRVRTEVTGLTDRFELFDNWSTGSTFSIGYNLVGSRLVHVSLRPYLTVGWTNHPLDDLSRNLNPNGTALNGVEEEFMNFGLKVIFYNGPWD